MPLQNPCKGCLARSPTCHATCAAYAEYAEERELMRQERRMQHRLLDAMLQPAERAARVWLNERKKRGR